DYYFENALWGLRYITKYDVYYPSWLLVRSFNWINNRSCIRNSPTYFRPLYSKYSTNAIRLHICIWSPWIIGIIYQSKTWFNYRVLGRNIRKILIFNTFWMYLFCHLCSRRLEPSFIFFIIQRCIYGNRSSSNKHYYAIASYSTFFPYDKENGFKLLKTKAGTILN